MSLQAPWVLLLLLLLPALLWWERRRSHRAAVTFSSLRTLRHGPVSWRLRLRPLLLGLRVLGLALLIAAVARPRKGTVLAEISTEGIAIEAVIDRSGSMRAEMDYYGDKLNRLEVVKRVLADFIRGDERRFAGRSGDLIGLVTFARFADTVCPLILSHDVLLEMLRQTQLVTLRSEDGTAIGDAIALSAARLRKAEEEIQRRRTQLGLTDEAVLEGANSEAFRIKSKAIILLTDGQNNVGDYDPLQAAALAEEWGITVYTIGIGSSQAFEVRQTLLGPMKVPTRNELDEGLLKAIAEKTGGFYGRADDAEALQRIVAEINEKEKTEVKAVQYTHYSEKFTWLALPALLVLLLEILANCTIFRKIP